MSNQFIQNRQEDFDKTIEHFKKELNNIRAGRANVSMIESIMVDSYGVKTPITQLSSIAIPEPKSMTIEPWDKNLIKAIEKAIVQADLGLSVSAESGLVRVTVPQMTEENRKNLVKLLNEKLEDAKIALKLVREKTKEEITEAEKASEITEDDKYDFVKELDEKTQELNKKLQEMATSKEKEIMTV